MKVGLELDLLGARYGRADPDRHCRQPVEVLLFERLGQLRKLVRIYEAVDDHLADARDGLVALELAVPKHGIGGALDGLELRVGDRAVRHGCRSVWEEVHEGGRSWTNERVGGASTLSGGRAVSTGGRFLLSERRATPYGTTCAPFFLLGARTPHTDTLLLFSPAKLHSTALLSPLARTCLQGAPRRRPLRRAPLTHRMPRRRAAGAKHARTQCVGAPPRTAPRRRPWRRF